MAITKVTNRVLEDESVGTAQLQTAIQTLLSNIRYVQTEAVIGSTECKFGYFGETTKARGDTYFGADVNATYLADFKRVNENGTVELVRMENINPLTYAPWQNFFPYKPTGNVVSTKIFAKITNMDTTGSNDDLTYTLYVNWLDNKAIITGNYILTSFDGGTNNQTFIKQWDFTNGVDATIRTDANSVESRFNTLGERSYAATFNTYTGDCEYVIGITTAGINKLPVFKYNGSIDPTINETANISLFIENTFRY